MSFKFWKKHTADGAEIPDPTPIEIPLDNRPLTLQERIQRLVADPAMMQVLKNKGVDTFDEANDFDTEPEPDNFPGTPYEMRGMADDLALQTRADEMLHGVVQPQPQDRVKAAWDRAKAAKAAKTGSNPPSASGAPTGEAGAK